MKPQLKTALTWIIQAALLAFMMLCFWSTAQLIAPSILKFEKVLAAAPGAVGMYILGCLGVIAIYHLFRED